MRLVHRLQSLELKIKTRQSGCKVTLFIVVPQEMLDGPFDSDSYRPTSDEIEKYMKQLKDDGQCRGCEGSCAIDWSPHGFKNHTLSGEGGSSSPEPKISYMFCANVEIPLLYRQIRNGERAS